MNNKITIMDYEFVKINCKKCEDETFYCRFCHCFCPFQEINHIVEARIHKRFQECTKIVRDLGTLDKYNVMRMVEDHCPDPYSDTKYWFAVARICTECYENWCFTENGYSLIKGT